jgi:hypothetical protein
MSTIKLYQSTTQVAAPSPNAGLVNPSFRPEDFGDGRGIEKAGRAFVQFQESQDQKTRLDLRNKYSEDMLSVAKEAAAMESSAPLGAPEHVANVEAMLQRKLEARLKSVPERFQAEYKADYARIQAAQVQSAIGFEARQAGVKAASDVNSVLNNYTQMAAENPDRIAFFQSEWNRTVDEAAMMDPRISAEQTQEMRDMGGAITFAAGKGTVRSLQTEQQLDEFLDQMGEEGSVFRQGLNGENYVRLKDYAEAQRQVIVTKQEKVVAEADISRGNDLSIEWADASEQYLLGNVNDEALNNIVAKIRSAADSDLPGMTGLYKVATGFRARQILNAAKSGSSKAASPYKFKLVDQGQEILAGRLTKDGISALQNEGYYKEAGDYEKHLRLADLYERRAQAQVDRDGREARRLQNEIERETASIQKEQDVLWRQDLVYKAENGLVSREDIEENRERLGSSLNTARQALRRYETMEDKDREQAKELAQIKAANDLEEGLPFMSPDDGLAAVDELVEEYDLRSTKQGEAIRKRLRTIVNEKGVEYAKRAEATRQLTYAMTYDAEKSGTQLPNISLGMDAEEKKYLEYAIDGLVAKKRETLADAEDGPQQLLRFQQNIVQKVGFIPQSFATQVRQLVSTDDDGSIALAIKMKKAYESSRTTLADSMSGEDFAFLNLVEDNVDLDIPPLRAVEMARDAIRVYGTTDPSTADQAYNSSLGKDTNERNEAISSVLSDFVDGSNWDGVNLPPEAAVEFNELSKLTYRQHGKLGPAQSTAWSMLKQRWGVSYVSGNAEIVRSPIEKYYRAPSLTDEENGRWIREEVTSAAKGFGHDLRGKKFWIKPHPTIVVEGRPTYNVYYQESNGIHTIPQMEAMAPDWKDSKYARAVERRREWERTEADLEKARIQKEVDKRFEEEQRLTAPAYPDGVGYFR